MRLIDQPGHDVVCGGCSQTKTTVDERFVSVVFPGTSPRSTVDLCQACVGWLAAALLKRVSAKASGNAKTLADFIDFASAKCVCDASNAKANP